MPPSGKNMQFNIRNNYDLLEVELMCNRFLTSRYDLKWISLLLKPTSTSCYSRDTIKEYIGFSNNNNDNNAKNME